VSSSKSVVAIVDDDPRVLESLEELLESAGYVARSFSSAGALLSSGLSGIDLLITDIGMPEINGFELRDKLKRTRPELPVFLISGRHEILDQQSTQEADGLFQKPFDGQALLAAIDGILQNKRRGACS
jgi:FixJ family two-component response regulator